MIQAYLYINITLLDCMLNFDSFNNFKSYTIAFEKKLIKVELHGSLLLLLQLAHGDLNEISCAVEMKPHARGN